MRKVYETTPKDEMDEIIAGWSGEKNYESTMADISELSDFVTKVLDYIIQFVNYMKELLGI